MIIAKRFCGPPESGNGGYTAGRLAAALGGGPVEVTLRKPPPLDRELTVERYEGGRAVLQDGAEIVAEARRAALELAVPEPVGFARAEELSQLYHDRATHHFPTCFGCGPARAAGDGLRVFGGADPAGGPTAAPFVPTADLADASDCLRLEFVWAALDCIGYFAAASPDYPMAVLGRMTAESIAPVRTGEACVVLGWWIGREGRKLQAGTALFGSDLTLRGRARQTWILL